MVCNEKSRYAMLWSGIAWYDLHWYGMVRNGIGCVGRHAIACYGTTLRVVLCGMACNKYNGTWQVCCCCMALYAKYVKLWCIWRGMTVFTEHMVYGMVCWWCILCHAAWCVLWHDIVWYGKWEGIYGTSSTAQGGGGSFKKRKTIGEIGCCESRMSKQKHWPID